MVSQLFLTSVSRLQGKIMHSLASKRGYVVYVSLNKPRNVIEKTFKKRKLKAKLFYIDDFEPEDDDQQVLHIPLHRIDLLTTAIISYMRYLHGNCTVVIDSLSTLLIYNDNNKVAKFLKQIIAYGSNYNVEILAFSPKTKGEELLTKVYNFFDEVKK